MSIDQDYRLEPSQLAGFPQTFRSLISESLVGSVAAPTYETYGAALDLKLAARTYVGIRAEQLRYIVDRHDGDLVVNGFVPPAVTGSTAENLNYRERDLTIELNQLLGDDFVIGASYKLTQAQLHDTLPEVPVSVLPTADQMQYARLHQITGYILFNHPSGFFAKSETAWYEQHNDGFATPEPGDEFFQQNFYVGYRLAHRRVELLLALLNATGQDYRLESLDAYQELPRKRVFEVRLDFVF